MALGMSTVGILAIVVIILALAVVLLGVMSRVKKLNTTLKAREEDKITPYIRTINYYRKGNFSQETKINALNKISKQFFRDLFSFNSEKTFEEISQLTKAEDDDIKKFCTSMGILRYSKSLGKGDIETLYRYFESILIKRKPQRAPEIHAPVSKKPMSMEELIERKMKKDIQDIKQELSKITISSTPSASSQKTPQSPQATSSSSVSAAVPIISTSSGSSQGQASIEEKLARITEEINKESMPEKSIDIVKSEKPRAITTAMPEASITATAITATMKEHEKPEKLMEEPAAKIVKTLPPPVKQQAPPSISPNKIIKQLIKNAPLEKPRRIIVRQYTSPASKPVLIPKADILSKKMSRLPLKKVKLNAEDEERLNREILSLNARLQRLVDREMERKLGEMRMY